MQTEFPPIDEVRHALTGLAPGQLTALAKLSRVNVHTLLKIRSGEIQDPGYEKVRQFMPFLKLVAAAPPAKA